MSAIVRAVSRLLHMQWLLFRNTFRHYPARRKFSNIFGWLVILSTGVFFGFGSWSFVRVIHSPDFQRAFAESGVEISFDLFVSELPILIMTAAFMMGLLANISVLLQILYLSGDMEFLLAAPIPTRAVFLSKLFQAILPVALLIGALGGPALVGLGLAQSFAAGYYLLIPVFLLVLVTAGAGLASLMVMLLVRLISPRRAAEAIALVGGLSIFLCSQSGSMMTIDESLTTDRIAGIVNLSQPFAGAWNPISWAGSALVALGDGRLGTGFLYTLGVLSASGGAVWLATVGAERLYLSGWSKVMLGRRKARKRRAGRISDEIETGRRSFLPSPIGALVRKDLLLFRRDLRNFSQLILPVIMAVIWGVSFGTGGGNAFSPEGRILGSFGLFMAVMMAWGFAMRFGLGAFSLEGPSWWIIKTSPVRVWQLLTAKYFVTFIPSSMLGGVFLLLLSVLTGRPVEVVAYDAISLIFTIAAISSLMLSFGIWNAKFDWKDPREVQGGGSGGCLISLASVLVILLILGLFQGLPFVLVNLAGWSLATAYATGAVAGALVCLALGLVPLAVASGKVPRLGEK